MTTPLPPLSVWSAASATEAERVEFDRLFPDVPVVDPSFRQMIQAARFQGYLAGRHTAAKAERKAALLWAAEICEQEARRDDLTGDYRYAAGICENRLHAEAEKL